MVELISETLLDQSISVSVSDGTNISRIETQPVTVPNFSGFTYAEAFVTEVEFLNAVDLFHNINGSGTFSFGVQVADVSFPPVSIFSSSASATAGTGTIGSNQSKTVDLSTFNIASAQATGDVYIDKGITLSNFIDGQSEFNSLIFDGAQTIDVNLKASVLGRRP